MAGLVCCGGKVRGGWDWGGEEGTGRDAGWGGGKKKGGSGKKRKRTKKKLEIFKEFRVWCHYQ